MKQGEALLKVINKVGSKTKLADILGCHKAYISLWTNKKAKIPVKYLDKLVELSKGEFKKKDFRPDLYKFE